MNWYKIAQTKNTVPKILILPLLNVYNNLDFIASKGINLISIRDTKPGANQIMYDAIDKQIKNLFVSYFDDLWYDEDSKHGTIPNTTHISDIISWAKKQYQTNHKPFIVHCTAGISRSSAVAILLKYTFEGEKSLKQFDPSKYSPNPKILEIGESLLGSDSIKSTIENSTKEYDSKNIE